MAEHFIDVIAGLQFYKLNAVADALQQGIRLRWQREPHNPADRNAISLWLDRSEALQWEILNLIPANKGIETWKIGHLRRDLAAELTPLLDARQGLDVFVDGGDRDGAWSLDVRLEGPAIDTLTKLLARRDADRKARIAAKCDLTEQTDEILDALSVMVRLFPEDWKDVVVELSKDWTDQDGCRQICIERVRSPDPMRWPNGELHAGFTRSAERVHAERLKDATFVFGPIIEAENAKRDEVLKRRRQKAAERRDAERRATAARLIAEFNETGRPVQFDRALEPYLPWLRRSAIEAKGLKAAHCRIAAKGTTAHGGLLYLYLPELDPTRAGKTNSGA
ncbi:HIRAN domain-containing protein [Azospirillum brasilense]|uniref:HIRAN domain-containing protein n=1 Tax=Azospirillum brasilense TaxID=192 RepID=UPI0019096C0F|nr:HIRAN domain-containing protein [Azospirillum brasilense]